MAIEIDLPDELRPFRNKVFNTAKSFIKVKPHKSFSIDWWQSRIGGNPYFPKTMTYPTDNKGRPLLFLAQINFEDVPPIDSYPDKGILQFYISDDDLHGLDLDDMTNQNGFKILYFEEIDRDETNIFTDFSFLPDFDYSPLLPNAAYPVEFRTMEEAMPVTDIEFETEFGEEFFQQFGDREWDVKDEYTRQVSAKGHKIGGYAHFTQWDPRTADEPMVLLFQVDSDPEFDISWGDMGVGNFFILKEDLEKRNFSKVMFYWDCY